MEKRTVSSFLLETGKVLIHFQTSLPSFKKLPKKNLTVTKVEMQAEPTQKTITSRRNTVTTGIKSFKEFKFDKNVNIEIDYEELEKKYNNDNPKVTKDSEVESVVEPDLDENGIEKTRVLRKKPAPPQQDLDKTRVVLSKSLVPKKESTETRLSLIHI